jgi:5-formyltetrahydrofolate cyclo-ligase
MFDWNPSVIFDSLGIGELGIIAVVAVLFVDPSKVGAATRTFAKFRRKWNNLQREVKDQFDTLTLEENLRDSVNGIRAAKAALRREGRDAARALTAADRAMAAEKALGHLRELPAFRDARTVALFCATFEEVDTENIIRHALAEGKTVRLPYLPDEGSAPPRMAFATIRDYDRDLTEGAFGILEPREELRGERPGGPAQDAPEPDLILIPGVAFDERGGRVGRGKGFYDRFLEGKNTVKVGLAFEAQVLRKKLPLEAHDQLLDGLVTEAKLRNFSQPVSAPPGAAGA